MKKFLAILAIFILFAAVGCSASNETAAPKGEYNIAYVTISFITEEAKEHYVKNHPEDPGLLHFSENLYSSNVYRTNDDAYYCYITDWEYGKNDTIILYLKDGRTMQTASENVLLMYDPDIY